MVNEQPKTENPLLPPLRQQRGRTRASITRIRKSVEEANGPLNLIELECRLEIVTTYIKQLMAYQTEIEKLDNSDNKRGELEDVCVGAQTVLKSKIHEQKCLSGLNDQTAFEQSSYIYNVSSHKLPSIKIPTFTGKYSEYKNFISCFNKLVHEEKSLSDIEKFNYLISCLRDDALKTVQAFQINADNYKLALARLAERYDNKCLIFNNLVSSLFALPKLGRPNASELRQLVDNVSAILDSLSTLGTPTEINHSLLIHIVLSKVDSNSKAKWDEQLVYKELPTWSQCSEVLIRRCQFLEVNERHQSTSEYIGSHNNKFKKDRSQASSYVTSESSTNECAFCSSTDHSIISCASFKKLDVLKRFDFAKVNSICINCLKKGHSLSNCKGSRCKVCNQKHHTLLHRFQPSQTNHDSADTFELNNQPSTSAEANVNLMPPSSFSAQSVPTHGKMSQIILATALVFVKDRYGIAKPARAILDSGSQVNFVTENLAQTLGLKRKEKCLKILGIGDGNLKIRQSAHAVVKSRINNYEIASEFYITKNITNWHPNFIICREELDIPENLPLADPRFDTPQPIDLLIGADIFFDLLSIGQIKLGPNRPTIQKTLLGWIVSGKYTEEKPGCTQTSSLLVVDGENNCEINKLLQRFWEIEELPKQQLLTSEQKLCEDHFVQNTSRLPDGRFEVKLPFKLDPSQLGESFQCARRRFLSLERRLASKPNIKQQYIEFMQEYINLGHMSVAHYDVTKTNHYFIPHQYVLRPDSTTTKLRVVFDASCKTTSQYSLNDLLMVGPTIQPDLFSTILGFRLNKYAVSADITKMYRQIWVHEADQRYQLILWRESPDKPLLPYKLRTVTYGTAPAPFLAIRCLKEMSNLFKEKYPCGANVIENDFYVDDLLTGSDSEHQLKTIVQEVVTILGHCGFTLAKWYSNHSQFATHDEKQLTFNDMNATNTLGMTWNVLNDTLHYNFKQEIDCGRNTKRSILSTSSRLFDPLGLLGPFVVKAKIILQELWLLKLDWDESIPLHIETPWLEFKQNLERVENLKIPRFVGTTQGTQLQVHGFADASTRAFGCCIYIRADNGGQVTVNLLAAKSKVAPLKTKTLPRLELCAAHLLINLWKTIKSLIKFSIEKTVMWTDSEIVLHWLNKHPSSLSTFVGNRTADILESSSGLEWRHVPSSKNPADLISRGCTLEELQSSIWFTGPSFLKKKESSWPINQHFETDSSEFMIEDRKTKTSLNVAAAIPQNEILEMIKRHSSYNKVLRIVGYIIRFITASKRKSYHPSIILTAIELEQSFLKIIQMIQHEEFNAEITQLRSAMLLKTNVQRLSPFLQTYETGGLRFVLLRVGGRLMNSPLTHDSKFPLLMGKGSHFIQIFVRHLHFSNCHAGAKILISLLRQRIWIINAREIARKTVRNCVRCFRFQPKLLQQLMGNLPKDRFGGVRPFLISGVDLCGPVNTTLKLRGRPPNKTFIAVFVCFSSRAVHLEALSDLMSDSFLLSFRRFIARRGLPQTLWCDNGKNFVGAASILNTRSLSADEVKNLEEFGAVEGVEVRFIPPRSPHFGGLWEAAVKSAKYHLLRTITGKNLTFEELTTVLADVEAILNSRPMCPLSEDPSDGEALTPGHLLIGCPLKTVSTTCSTNLNTSFVKRFREICSLKERFWRSWLDDFIRSQQQRVKWTSPSDNLKPDTMVIVHDDNIPPQNWILGRVTEVVSGTDGRVRVAVVRTNRGLIKRPIHKLAPLPKANDDSQSSTPMEPCNAGGVAAIELTQLP